ncbi:unnamed protein product [Victoria cruziana]
MANMQRLQNSTLSTANNYSPSLAEGVPDQFPAGLRVLVVDDDTNCLRILEQMLKKCMYTVTIYSRAAAALSLLREKKGCFDLVLSDVHMPDMDGFRLLELVGLEMDLPVIMMSADGETSAVMKGIKHGACDYLIKPIRMEELKNIWQHVIRRKCVESKEHEQSCSMIEKNERHGHVGEETDYASSVHEGSDGNWKVQRKRKESKDEEVDVEQENEDPAASKKPRVVWTAELHQQFINAVNQLGIEKAVPKRILELMNVPGLTRENVASHLQKFRLYLKKISVAAPNQGVICSSFDGSAESNGKLGPMANLSVQALAASGQMTPQSFAALHAEFLGHNAGNLVMQGADPPLVQAALHGLKGNLVERGTAFAQPVIRSLSDLPKQFAQTCISVDDTPSAYSTWQEPFGAVTPCNSVGMLSSHNNMVGQLHQPEQRQSLPLETGHVINVQPSNLVSSTSLSSFPCRSNTVSSSCDKPSIPSFVGGPIADYCMLSPTGNLPVPVGPMPQGSFRTVGSLSGYPVPSSTVNVASSCCVDSSTDLQNWQLQNSVQIMGANPHTQVSAIAPNIGDISYGLKGGQLLDQGTCRSLGSVNKGPCTHRRSDVDSGSPPSFTGELSEGIGCMHGNVNVVKQEVDLEFVDSLKVGLPVMR